MTIYWCGGEDIDFPTGTKAVGTNAGMFNSSYSRCYVRASVNQVYSQPFTGVTSFWLHCVLGMNVGNSGITTNGLMIGLTGSTSVPDGIWITSSSSGGNPNSQILTVRTLVSGTQTQLCTGALPAFASSTTAFHSIDLQIINYGVSSTINLYLDGSLYATFSGNSTVTGVSNFTNVALGVNLANENAYSQIIVADSDTRSLNLATMAPNANGTTQNWSNPAFSNYNPITINDANAAFVNTTAQDQQANLTDLPAGSFSIIAVKQAVRAALSAGATPTGVKLGFNNGGTVAVGSTHTASLSFQDYEDLFTTDPTTGVGWVQASMNGLQNDMRSA
jgi:hypothetical protein